MYRRPLIIWKQSWREYHLWASSRVCVVLSPFSACERPCKSSTYHKKKKLIFLMFENYTQGAGGWGLSCHFQKYDFWLIFYLLNWLRKKNSSASTCIRPFSNYTLIDMEGIIRGRRYYVLSSAKCRTHCFLIINDPGPVKAQNFQNWLKIKGLSAVFW